MKSDKIKIRKILLVLYKHREGLWLRRLSRECKLSVSTVQYYINNILDDFVENLGVKDNKGNYFGLRIIVLKPKIRKIIEEGNFEKIYDFLKMYGKL